MTCKNCGREISESSSFCEYCGQTVTAAQGQTPYPATEQQQNPYAQPQQQPYNPYGQPAPQQPYSPYPPDPNAPQGYYAPPPNGMPVPVRANNNASVISGVMSIVLAVISFFIFGFLCFVALGCGVTALTSAKKSSSPAAGYVLGTIGTILSAIFVVLFIIGLFTLN